MFKVLQAADMKNYVRFKYTPVNNRLINARLKELVKLVLDVHCLAK